MRVYIAATALIALAAPMRAQDVKRSVPLQAAKSSTDVPATLPLKFVGPPTTGAITPIDLMTRVYKFADDSMMGRLAGTKWNDKGTDYIAAEMKRLGIKPAGDDGYFQHPLVKKAFADTSWVGVGDKRFALWKDFAPRPQGDTIAAFDGVPVVFGGVSNDTSTWLPAAEAAGKVVLFRVGNGADGQPDYNSVNRAVLSGRFPQAAAVVVAQLSHVPPGYVETNYADQQVGLKAEPVSRPKAPAYFYVTDEVADAMLGAPIAAARTGAAGQPFKGRILQTTGVAPGRNVIAMIEGSDPVLKNQYVVIGAHNDHEGFNRTPVEHGSMKGSMMRAAPQRADGPSPKPTAEQWAKIRVTMDSLRRLHPSRPGSIYNGADDDASGSMALLEIAERYATSPNRPKRSVIFNWHVGEESGMLGSTFFTDNPTVPRDSIVAQLNIDMVGRGRATDATGEDKEGKLLYGGPGYLQLIGSRRLSTELGDLVERTNTRGKLGFKFDYSIDASGHPQNIYCRSDHWADAKHGIPVVFFTTGGHADYHQVTDEPQYLDYRHSAKVAQLIHATAMNVANLAHRVKVDKPKPDPNATCKQ